eukprot:COSAG01_NODE_2503_length_7555_cov_3.547881_10_plen_187_part_01
MTLISKRKWLYQSLSPYATTTRSRLLNRIIISLIILNVFAVAMETEPLLSFLIPMLEKFEYFSVAIFSLEYILRVFACKQNPRYAGKYGRIKYIFSFHALTDLVAIIPFYIPLFINLDLRAVRLMRLTRLLQLFKLEKYMLASKRLVKSFNNKREEMFLTFFVALMLLIILSIVMYFVEGPAQPDKF